jgi:hypothetical protein
MTVRNHRDTETALLKRENVRRPIAWTIHPDDVAAEGQHCQARRCHNPVTVVTWRYFRSAAAGRVLVAEHFVCDQHGQEFAQRYHVTIEAAPSRRSLRERPH